MILLKTRYSGAVPSIARKQLRPILKAAWAATGAFWHREYRPRHFTLAGARKYGYTPRSGEQSGLSKGQFFRSYTGRKLKKKHHRLPLVWSGRSRSRTALRDVRSTSKGARVVLHANALNYRNPHSKINMREEVRTISPDEERRLVAELDAEIQRGLDGIRETERA